MITINIIIRDFITTKKKIHWRLFLHLGPNQNKSILNETIKKINNESNCIYKWKKTWYSPSFGERIKRNTFASYGLIEPGTKTLNHEITVSSKEINK